MFTSCFVEYTSKKGNKNIKYDITASFNMFVI